MSIIIATVKHAPENCGMFYAEARKATLAMLAQREELQKKYNTKMLGAWVVSNEHLVIWVMEVPSLDTLEQFLREPVMMASMAFNTIEIKIATSMEESAKLLLQQG